MNQSIKTAIFLLRVGLGFMFAYAGFSKIITPGWSAAGYLTHATTFSGFYTWLASPSNIGWVNFLNEWGLFLVGLALIFGLLVKWASYAGIAMMVLYWFPILHFPYVGTTAYIVDEHFMFVLIFILLIASGAGTFWGLDSRFAKRS